jgi:O-acetyl-ADP-ribose deacetylase (regulator of RNase III)
MDIVYGSGHVNHVGESMFEVSYLPVQEIKSDVLVCPVNCVGVMGKGLAKAIKELYPWSVDTYEKSCGNRQLTPGNIISAYPNTTLPGSNIRNPIILHAATKNHWKNKSQIVWVKACLREISTFMAQSGATSIAIPKIGCGLGGLSWIDVEPLFENVFLDEDYEVIVFDREIQH